MDKVKLKKLFKKLVQEYTGTGASGGNAGDGNNIVSPRVGGIFPDDEQELLDYMYKSIYGGDGGHYKNYVKTGNYNSLNKQGMFELKKYIKKIIKEQAYGRATLTTQGQSISGAPGIWEQEKDEILTSAEEMYGIAAEEHFNKIHLYPGKKPGDMVNYRTDKTYIIVEDDLKTIQYISGHSSPELTDLANSLGLNKIGSGQFAGIDTYEGPHTINTPEDMKSVIDGMVSATSGEAQRQSAFYTRQPGTGGTGIDEDHTDAENEKLKKISKELNKASKLHKSQSVALNKASKMHKGQADKIGKIVKEQEGGTGAVDPEAKAYEMGLKRLQKGVIQFQLRYVEKQKAKAMAQSATAAAESGKGFEEQIQALKDQMSAIDNPEQEQKEGLLKEYINSRKNSNLMMRIDLYKQTILLENTMKSIFAKFNDGKTNEEVLRHFIRKSINMPEQFIIKARKQYENLKKQRLELGFMEQEAKDIVAPPVEVPDIALFDIGDDEKVLANGIYQEKKINKK